MKPSRILARDALAAEVGGDADVGQECLVAAGVAELRETGDVTIGVRDEEPL